MEPSPRIIVVSDSSDDQILRSNREISQHIQLSTGSKIVHMSSNIQSLTFQKNKAIEYVLRHEECFAVQILDDDTLPSGDFFVKQLEFLKDNSGAIGVSGVTVAPVEVPKIAHPRWLVLPLKLVGLLGGESGRISPAGTGIPVTSETEGPVRVDWLIGCSMWKSVIFNKVKYRDSLKGSCLFEDVDFSQRASKHGGLFVIPNAYLQHLEAPEERPTSDIFAYRFNRNRFFVIQNMENKIKSNFYFLLSSAAISAFYLAKLFVNAKPGSEHFRKMFTNSVAGTIDAYRNREPK